MDPNSFDQDFVTHFGRIGWDHTLSGTLLNHITLGFNRTNSRNVSPAVNVGVDWPAQLGLTGVSGPTFPQFNINNGFDTIGQARGDDDIANQAEVADNLSWSKGRHTITFGGDYRWIQYNNEAFDSVNGVYNFSNNETAAGEGVLANEGGYSLASFLLGQVDNANLNVFSHYPRYTQNYYAFFVQDNFRVNQNLTLNLGLRWDVDTPRKEADNNTSNFDPSVANPGPAVSPVPWSLQVQQQLAQDLLLSVAYVGNKGQNLRSAAAAGSYNNISAAVSRAGSERAESRISDRRSPLRPGFPRPIKDLPERSAMRCGIIRSIRASTPTAAWRMTECPLLKRSR